MVDGPHGFCIAIEIKALVSHTKIGVTWNFGDYPSTTTPVLVNIRIILYQGYDIRKIHKANCKMSSGVVVFHSPSI